MSYGYPGYGYRAKRGAPALPAVWRLATVRAGETAYGTSGTSTSAFERMTGRVKDKLSPAHMSKLRYLDPAYWVNLDGTETAIGNSPSIQRSLEIGAAVGRVSYAGTNVGTIPNGSALWSDDLLPAALGLSAFDPNADVWHRCIKDQPTGQSLANFPATGPGTPAGEASRRMATSIDRLMQTGALPADGTAWSQIDGAPGLVIGLAADHGPTIMAIGDSRFYGFGGDAGPGSGTAGGAARMALEQSGRPHAMQARSATLLSDFVASNFAKATNRLPLIAYVSDIFANWSVNDMSAGRTASQILADIVTFVTKARTINPNVRVWWATMAPKTNGSNVASGLFAAGASNGRDTFNAALRSSPATYLLAGAIDIAAAVESVGTPGTWSNYAGDSTDGTHSTQAGQVKEAVPIKACADALPVPL